MGCSCDVALADAEDALCVVQTAGREVGVDVGREDRLLPGVGQLEG